MFVTDLDGRIVEWNASGERVGNVCLHHDVTEARRIETALERTHSILRAVVDETSGAVFVKDVRGCYVMINAAGSPARRRERSYRRCTTCE